MKILILEALKIIIPIFFMITSYLGFTQNGPAGVGSTDGTSTLKFWIDPNLGVSVDQNKVNSVTDLSGNSCNFSSSGTNRPSLVIGGINNQNHFEFDNSTFQKLNLNKNTGVGNYQSLSLLYVFKFTKEQQDLNLFGYDNRHYIDYGTRGSSNGGVTTKERIVIRNGWNMPKSNEGSVKKDIWHIGTAIYRRGSGGAARNYFYNNGSLVLSINKYHYFSWGVGTSFDIGAANDNGNSFHGSLGEVIFFNTNINNAKRILLENYLAWKYGLLLDANDVYTQDNTVNGDYDHDIAGICRIASNNLHNDAQGTGILRINNPSGLGDDEFLMWGHDNGLMQASERSDVPTGVPGRLGRVWRVSEVNSQNTPVDVGSIDMLWDLSNLGTITATDLRLLIDTDNDGVFSDETPITGASSMGNGIYKFAGITDIQNNVRFTLATMNLQQTALPINLIDFQANINEDLTINILWQTASETNNDFFTIERSDDASNWEKIKNIDGAGNHSGILDYQYKDKHPIWGN